MSICYTPILAYRTSDGSITFNENQGIGSPFELPCGKCMGCRLEQSRQWAIRCVHESKFHEQNAFITMTYNDNEKPSDGSLKYDHMKKFWKDLRKRLGPKKIKMFYCGEYGLKNNRPHYHGIVFGHDFGMSESKRPRFHRAGALKNFLDSFSNEDEKLQKKLEIYESTDYGNVYISDELEKIWKKGFCTVAEMSFESASYVARYVTKKVTGMKADEHYKGREPEFAHMSRGIGEKWIEKYHKEVFPHNNIIYNGRQLKIPRYYEKWLEKNHPKDYKDFKEKRNEHLVEPTPRRRLIEQLICQATRFRNLSRGDDVDINPYDDQIIQHYRRVIHDKESVYRL